MEITLISSDEKELLVSRRVAEKSLFIRAALEDLPGNDINEPFPLPSVKYSTLKTVMEWCEHHIHDPDDVYPERKPTSRLPDAWDEMYLERNVEDVFDIILAATYLDIPALLNLCCWKVASMIRGKSAKEIMETFRVEHTFTPEEEASIRKEEEWSNDDSPTGPTMYKRRNQRTDNVRTMNLWRNGDESSDYEDAEEDEQNGWV